MSLPTGRVLPTPAEVAAVAERFGLRRRAEIEAERAARPDTQAPGHVWPWLRALSDAAIILRHVGEGLLRAGVPLLAIALVSFGVHHVLVHWAAGVALGNGPAGLGIFVIAVAIRLVLLAFGIYVAAAAMRIEGVSILRLGAYAGHAGETPIQSDGFSGTIKMAIVPMVVLYAAWNQINWDIHQFLLSKFQQSTQRIDLDNLGVQQDLSNISFQNGGWRTYIPWAIGLWILKLILDKVAERVDWSPLDFVIVVLEVGWVTLGWLVISPSVDIAGSWLRSRVVWVDWIGGVGGWLSSTFAVFDLPDLLATVGSWLWQLLVHVSTEIIWPLVWVAVVGLLVGWVRGDTDRPVATGHAKRSVRMLGRIFTSSTTEVREKFYPLATLARVIWRAGPIPVLVIAILYNGLVAIMGLLRSVLLTLVPPYPGASVYYDTWMSFIEALLSPLRTVLIVACFALILRRHLEQRGEQPVPAAAAIPEATATPPPAASPR